MEKSQFNLSSRKTADLSAYQPKPQFSSLSSSCASPMLIPDKTISRPPPYSSASFSSTEISKHEVLAPFAMDETTQAPVHKDGCDVCKAYLAHVAEGSHGHALEHYFRQKAAELQRLQAQIAATANAKTTQVNWHDQELEKGSEVFTNAFASTAWSNHRGSGARLFINQNYTMTVLKLDGILGKRGKFQWDREFVFPTAQLPGSAMATANSFFSKRHIRNSKPSKDGGRDLVRHFYFDMDQHLCEWVYVFGTGWQKSSLQIRDADPHSIAALCCAQDGFASWSLFYVTKGVTEGAQYRAGRLMELRCSGGIDAKWSKPIDVGWAPTGSMNGKAPELPDSVGRFTVSAAATVDGKTRQLVLLGTSTNRTSQFEIYKWNSTRGKWVASKKSNNSGTDPYVASSKYIPRHATLVDGWGPRIFFQDGRDIAEWYGQRVLDLWFFRIPIGEGWSFYRPGPDACASEAPVTACSHSRGFRRRQHIFSVRDGKVVQTTRFGASARCVSKPISIRNL